MIKVALTGNIAAGKTLAQNFVLDLGISVLDCDEVCHFALKYDADIIEKVKRIFDQDNVIDENGMLARAKIGEIIFENQPKKFALEMVLHGYVKTKIYEFFKAKQSERVVIVAIPLLYEVGWQDMFDKTILIHADERIRLERLVERNNYSVEHAKARIASQIPSKDKISKSHFIVENNKSVDAMYMKLDKIMRNI